MCFVQLIAVALTRGISLKNSTLECDQAENKFVVHYQITNEARAANNKQ